MNSSTVSVRNADQILLPPESNLPYLRHNRADELTLNPGSLTAKDGKIANFDYDPDADLTIDATGYTVVPGFVDCHTHLPFVGWRAHEYEQKVTGVPYEEISRSGGGIASSARALAGATDEEVLEQSTALAQEMLASGTTAFECKSGYGLSIEAEHRSLKLAEKFNELLPQTTVSTALLAHAVPKGTTADEWMDEVEAALPHIVNTTKAQALDIYVESVAFTNEHLARMGHLAKAHNLALRAHVEQFGSHHSVPVALKAGARSVDHLEHLHIDDLKQLAESETAAVLLPSAEFITNTNPPRAKELAHHGAICVLATDLNPGTSPVTSIPLVIALAVRRYGWTTKEALLATTLNAAYTINLSKTHGSLEPGKQADFLLLDVPVEHIPYRLGHNPVAATFINGRPAYVSPAASERFSTKP